MPATHVADQAVPGLKCLHAFMQLRATRRGILDHVQPLVSAMQASAAAAPTGWPE